MPLYESLSLEDVEKKLDPYFDYLPKSIYNPGIEAYDEIVSELPKALWELKTGISVDNEGLDESFLESEHPLDEGINLSTLCSIMEIEEEQAKELLLTLKKNYENEERGLRISYLGDAFKLTTKQEHKDYYEKLVVNPETNTLSQAALEVLAIVAYNQPITRSEIDELRGVSCSYTIRKLLAKGLLKESGKSDMPGRPNLYKTTSEFLDYFGLATIEDLPEIKTSALLSLANLINLGFKPKPGTIATVSIISLLGLWITLI